MKSGGKLNENVRERLINLRDDIDAILNHDDFRDVERISSHAKPRKKKRTGLPDEIDALIDEGFFDKPVERNDVHLKLKEYGVNCTLSNLSMSLLELTRREKKLKRFAGDKKNSWKYVVRDYRG